LLTGIISNPNNSLFTYAEGNDWSNFYSPDFMPSFEVTFSDPALEAAANELCGDDLFCRFDISSTENTMVGLSTLSGAQEFEFIVESSQQS